MPGGPATIRAVTRRDLPAVAALCHRHLPGRPAPDLEGFLTATLFDDPWADPELPSLLAEQDGAVVGFIARQPRRMELDGSPLRAVICSHLVVAPEHRGAAAAARIARACLNGPQDLTYSDAAGDVVVRLWRVLGGDVDAARSSEWALAVRPVRWGARLAAAAVGRADMDPGAVPVPVIPMHLLWRRTLRAGREPGPGVHSRAVGPVALAEAITALTERMRLRPVADPSHLAHVLATATASGRRVESRIVHRRDLLVGAWSCVVRPGGVAQVLLLVGADRATDAVLADVARAARGWGATALAGRLEPHLRDAVRGRAPALGLARLPVFHTRDDRVRAALSDTASLLAKVEGEWWVP